jgi:hypothetical protein
LLKKVAVLQSNYFPWKGYFDIIHDVDVFIFHDDLQFTKNDWRNRNRIKTPNGTRWLTIPVGPRDEQLICEVQLPDRDWQKDHWNIIDRCYRKAPFFKQYQSFLEEVFLGKKWNSLSELNQYLIRSISKEFLSIKTEFQDSREYCVEGRKTDRLLSLLRKVGANIYLSGPAGRDYIDEKRFEEARIKLFYKNYDGYPEYPQFYPPFAAGVSIIDLLFHVGPDAPYYIWGWRKSEEVQA